MAAAQRLGLSNTQQVVPQKIPRDPQTKRIRRLRRVVPGASEQITAWMQARKHRYRAVMVTLTYAPGHSWQPRHISTYLNHVRRWLHHRGGKLRAVWVMELQKRGAPHYHVIIWLPRGLTLPMADKQGWWPHGMSNQIWARKPVNYLTKYASKVDSKGGAFPPGARIFGVHGCPIHLGWWRAPQWLRAIAEPGWKVCKRYGSWWCIEELAYALRSPWRVPYVAMDHVEIFWHGWDPQDTLPLWLLEIQAEG